MKSLVWFRNDLRTKDHQPLYEAAKNGAVCGIYCFDPRHFVETEYGFPKTGSLRAQFIIESIEDLRQQFRELGSELLVRVGKPEDVIPGIIKDLAINKVWYHYEPASEEKTVEENVKKAVGCETEVIWGNTLYHVKDLPFKPKALPDVFTRFRKEVEKKSSVRELIPAPEKLEIITGLKSGAIPEPENLGLEAQKQDWRAAIQFTGGSLSAEMRMQHYFWDSDRLQSYKHTRNGLLGEAYSSKLSPWLAHGCISPVQVYHRVKAYEIERVKNDSTYWLIFELIWRDFFRYSNVKHCDRIFYLGGIQGRKLHKKTDPAIFEKWKRGETGIPFVDANMRELNQTGFMSNRGRQNVASFLAQNLDFDWRWGAAWFESKLVDYDVYSNWGNWGYNATVGHDARNRYFNILSQAERYDKKGEYVKHWLPELKDLPPEQVHEPNKAGEGQQSLFESSIKPYYPEPMIYLEKSYERIRSQK